MRFLVPVALSCINYVLELYPFICIFSVLVFSFANTSITEHFFFRVNGAVERSLMEVELKKKSS